MNQRGMTLLEIMVAMGIVGVIIMIATTVLSTSHSMLQQSLAKSNLLMDRQFTVGFLSKALASTLRLSPAEDLFAPNDDHYPGFSALPAYPGCEYPAGKKKADFSILQLTRYRAHTPQAVVLRSWSEVSAGTPLEIHIRPAYNLVASTDDEYMYVKTLNEMKKAGPLEVAIVDADAQIVRRYQVDSLRKVAAGSDPDLTGPHVAMRLSQIKLGGKIMPTPDKTVKFIAQSLLFVVQTEVICTDNKGRVIKMSEGSAAAPQIMIDPSLQHYELTEFRMRYGDSINKATLGGVFTDFYSIPFSKRKCINTIELETGMRETNVNVATGTQAIVVSKRTLSLENHLLERPTSCDITP
jgi:prepilin-type N-terminal cleavage/methylation domain-containing protein